jgi:DNA integrity scanning protein DisA with diadenylate cyclase activity
MNYLWEQWLTNLDRVRFVLQALDIVLVLLLSYVVLVIIGERRTLWMVRGLIF